MAVTRLQNIDIPLDEIAAICRRYHVRELALFGSVLRDDFRPDSDVDVLVEFEPGLSAGLFEYFDLQDELADVFSRRVDLVMKVGLKPVIRDEVIESSKIIYAR